jgi:hypothetical protein
MDEPIGETDKEYMMFLLKLINNYLLDQEVPSWFSIKKLTLEPETLVETPEKETE